MSSTVWISALTTVIPTSTYAVALSSNLAVSGARTLSSSLLKQHPYQRGTGRVRSKARTPNSSLASTPRKVSDLTTSPQKVGPRFTGIRYSRPDSPTSKASGLANVFETDKRKPALAFRTAVDFSAESPARGVRPFATDLNGGVAAAGRVSGVQFGLFFVAICRLRGRG
jgi:hypothetical protein